MDREDLEDAYEKGDPKRFDLEEFDG